MTSTKKALTRFGNLTFLLVVCTALLTGCSSSEPSESDGRKIVEDMIAQNSHGCVKLMKFDKTNGLTKGAAYRLEYTAVIEFLQDCYYLGNEIFYSETREQAESMYHSLNGKKGQSQTVSGYIDFEKTEKGWRETNRRRMGY